MSRTALRNIGIIAVVALGIAFLPRGKDVAELALAILSLAFIAAIGFLGYRPTWRQVHPVEHERPSPRAPVCRDRGRVHDAHGHRPPARQRHRVVLWISLLAGSVLAVYNAWVESRRYSI